LPSVKIKKKKPWVEKVEKLGGRGASGKVRRILGRWRKAVLYVHKRQEGGW